MKTDKKNFDQLKREFDNKKYELKSSQEEIKTLSKAKVEQDTLISV